MLARLAIHSHLQLAHRTLKLRKFCNASIFGIDELDAPFQHAFFLYYYFVFCMVLEMLLPW